jgi:hypothetical protein
MNREGEIAAIERWVAERGVTRAPRAAYAAAAAHSGLAPDEEVARLAAVRIEMPDQRKAMKALWMTLHARRRPVEARTSPTRG